MLINLKSKVHSFIHYLQRFKAHWNLALEDDIYNLRDIEWRTDFDNKRITFAKKAKRV